MQCKGNIVVRAHHTHKCVIDMFLENASWKSGCEYKLPLRVHLCVLIKAVSKDIKLHNHTGVTTILAHAVLEMEKSTAE